MGIIYLIKIIILVVFPYLPQSFLGVFILFKFFRNVLSDGVSHAFTELSVAILSAEYVIYQNVGLAVHRPEQYGLFNFMDITASVLVLIFLVKIIAFIIEKVNGSGSAFGKYLISIAILVIIQISVVRFVYDEFLFIPLYHGIFYMLMNLPYVLNLPSIIQFFQNI